MFSWVDMGEAYQYKGVGFTDHSKTWTAYTLNVTSQRW